MLCTWWLRQYAKSSMWACPTSGRFDTSRWRDYTVGSRLSWLWKSSCPLLEHELSQGLGTFCSTQFKFQKASQPPIVWIGNCGEVDWTLTGLPWRKGLIGRGIEIWPLTPEGWSVVMLPPLTTVLEPWGNFRPERLASDKITAQLRGS